MIHRSVVQGIGWYGVMAILAAYALVNFSVLTSSNVFYQLLNLTGAAAIAFEAATKRDRQPMVLNIIWAGVALLALLRLWLG